MAQAGVSINNVELIDTNAQGVPAVGGAGAHPSSQSGRFVVFTSAATNLSPVSSRSTLQVYVKDRLTGEVDCVSVNNLGVAGNGPSSHPTITENGRYVAFASEATNLVANDANDASDVFVFDRFNRTLQCVSLTSTGMTASAASEYPSISPEGKSIVFQSSAGNLVLGDTNGVADLFVRERMNGSIVLASVNPGGGPANGASSNGVLSASGRFLAFQSEATNLVPGDNNRVSDVFVRDLVMSRTIRVSVDSSGRQGNGSATAPTISGDGRLIAYTYSGDGFFPGETRDSPDVLLYDRTSGLCEAVSLRADGTEPSSGASAPSISKDGRFIAFYSASGDLVPGDTNGQADVFVRDRGTGRTELVSLGQLGNQGDGDSFDPQMVPNGQAVLFSSLAQNLVDIPTSAEADAFILDYNAAPVAQSDSYTTSFNAALLVSGGGVLLNDLDREGNPITAVLDAPALNGTVTLQATGSFVYRPKPGYSGTDRFTYHATDGHWSGNQATVTVKVLPNQPPRANAGLDRRVEYATSTTPVLLDGSASTDPERDSLTYVWREGSLTLGTGSRLNAGFTLGVHTVELQVTDPFGNSSTDTAVVTVKDTRAPVLRCPSGIVVTRNLAAGAVVNYTATAQDASPGVILSCVPPSGSIFPAGISTVTCTATDVSGNQTKCSFTVQVISPASNTGATVTGSGSLVASGIAGTFSVDTSVQSTSRPSGSLMLNHSALGLFQSQSISIVTVSGTHARVFGKGAIGSGPVLDFVADFDDRDPASGGDQLRLELSDGRVFGYAPLTGGTLTVRPR